MHSSDRPKKSSCPPNLHPFPTNPTRGTESPIVKARSMTIPRHTLALAVAALAALLALAATPQLGGHVGAALGALGTASRPWLLVAAASFLAAFACTVGAWPAALT